MIEVDMTANSVRYTEKNFHPHTYRGYLSFSIQSAQEYGYKVWKIKLSSIPKTFKVDIAANSVRYSGKTFNPQT